MAEPYSSINKQSLLVTSKLEAFKENVMIFSCKSAILHAKCEM